MSTFRPIAIWITFLASASLQAGVAVTGRIIQGPSVGPVKQFYQGPHMRLEYSSGPKLNERHWVVYRGDNKTISVVDAKKKSFLEVSESDLDRLGGIFSGFSQLGKKKTEAPITPNEVTFKKEQDKQKVGKWTCTRYALMARGKKSGSLCVIPIEKTGAKRGDFKPLEALSRSFASLAPLAASQGNFLGFGIDRVLDLGFPVEIIGLDPAGKTVSRMEVESFENKALEASLFSNPAGYERNDLTSLFKNMVRPASGK